MHQRGLKLHCLLSAGPERHRPTTATMTALLRDALQRADR
jgi:hypothetical protein